MIKHKLTLPESKHEMKINKKWHEKNIMPKNPTLEERMKWHLAHQKNCSCRPIPARLAEAMKKKGIKI
jgi:hypothetical protein